MKVTHWISLSLAACMTLSTLGAVAQTQVIKPSQFAPNLTVTRQLIAQTMSAKPTAVVRSGNFKSGEHPTQGKVRIVTQNGQSFLELDQGFKTFDQGPDLVVGLHRSNNVLGTTQSPSHPLKAGDYMVLSRLQKFSGAQRYAIPAKVNLANYQSAVIWCRQFNATFGAATLN